MPPWIYTGNPWIDQPCLNPFHPAHYGQWQVPANTNMDDDNNKETRRRRRGHRQRHGGRHLAPGLKRTEGFDHKKNRETWDSDSKKAGACTEDDHSQQVAAGATGETQDTETEDFCLSSWLAGSPEPEDLMEKTSICTHVINTLDSCGSDETDQFLKWAMPHVSKLALKEQGSCRVIQKLLDVLGKNGRDELVSKLTELTDQLYTSPYGNYVLTKIIEVVPRPSLTPIIGELTKLNCKTVAKHRFGCRVLERLIEHCTEEQMNDLLTQCIEEAVELSKHQFGNFVIQSILEHGNDTQRNRILNDLVKDLTGLATHRAASHVVQQALNHCDEEDKTRIAKVLTHNHFTLAKVAANRYGGYVIEELRNALGTDGVGEEVRQQLAKALAYAVETSRGPKTDSQEPLDTPTMVRVCGDTYGLNVSGLDSNKADLSVAKELSYAKDEAS